ncbi:hypothetical protein ACFLZI_03475, partial [Nitrospirota bacterium]
MRAWSTSSGLFFKKVENGDFDSLEAVQFEIQEQRHGAQYYNMYRVSIRKSDGDELHVDMWREEDNARTAARELASRLSLKVE